MADGLYRCNCTERCRGEWRILKRSAWYEHKKFRQGNPIPPLPSDSSHRASLDLSEHTRYQKRPRLNYSNVDVPIQENSQVLETENEPETISEMPTFENTIQWDSEDEDVTQSMDSNVDGSGQEPNITTDTMQDVHGSTRSYEYTIPANLVPATDELKNSLQFIHALRNASLENGDLDEDQLYALRNPITEPLSIEDRDTLLSIKLFLSTLNSSDQTYKDIHRNLKEDDPSRNFLSHYQAKRKLAELTGVEAIVSDMCFNSCAAYTGPFADLQKCPICGEPRSGPTERVEGPARPRHFYTLPLGPQLQALWRTPAGAHNMGHRARRTEEIITQINDSETGEIDVYDDIYHGQHYLEAIERGDIQTDDMVLMFAMDGAQLYEHKQSDCWIYIWIILDLPPHLRYKKRHVIPGGFIPGPKNPKNTDSFLFPGFQHLAALQKEGLKVWNAATGRVFLSRLYLHAACADGPGSVYFTGLVGHQGAYPCRLYCGIKGRHKPGGPQYYPALLKPNDYDVAGCNHGDIDPLEVCMGNADVYAENLRFLLESRNPTEFKVRRRDTGISTLSIFSGLPATGRLPIPYRFPGDSMHVPNLNLGELLIPLWRGSFTCAKTDNVANWSWAVLRDEDIWKAHGAAVIACRPYIPNSYDRPPRNLAEKVNSGYKAKEWQNYFYGLAAALLHNILPHQFWQNFCKLVASIRILHRRRITREQLQNAYTLMCDFHREFESIYGQRRADRIHFIRPCLHALLHTPLETVRFGPIPLHATWTIERMIGDLGREIAQPSNPYQNLSERGLRRCQVNTLRVSYSEFTIEEEGLPRYALDIGDGYALLRAKERTAHILDDKKQALALSSFLLRENQNMVDENDHDQWEDIKVTRWARLQLPNGQRARSTWKEDKMDSPRCASCVKIEQNSGLYEYAQVHFYFNAIINEKQESLALVTMFSEPHPLLLEESYGTVISVTKLDVQVIYAKTITAVVAAIPHCLHTDSNSADQRYFIWEKMGTDMSLLAKVFVEDDDDDDDTMEID